MPRITTITIENFKGFSEPVRIELAPVTLLFGINSAGKSAVLHALHYAREILIEGNVSPDFVERGGDAVRLGGFHRMVHKREFDRTVRLELEVDLRDAWVGAYSHPRVGYRFPRLQPDSGRLGLELTPSKPHQPPDLSLAFSFDGQSLATLRPAGEEGLLEVDPWAPVFDVTEFPPDLFARMQAATEHLPIDAVLGRGWPAVPLAGIRDFATFREGDTDPRSVVLPFRTPLGFATEASDDSYPRFELPQAVEARLARYHEELHALEADDADGNLNSHDLDRSELDHDYESEILADAWRGFASHRLTLLGYLCEVLRKCLQDLCYVGPLRVRNVGISDAIEVSPAAASWADGSAAWAWFLRQSEADVATVNSWLSGPTGLGLGHRVAVRSSVEVDLAAEPIRALLADPATATLDELRSHLLRLAPHRRVCLTADATGLDVTLHDVGAGVSQVIPIVAAAVASSHTMVLLEQPELHANPAVQVGLGDLFASFCRERTFIAETHSEHVLLRLRRRIRETIAQTRPEGAPELGSEDVAVYVLEQTSGGLSARRLRLSADGDIVDPWPEGFLDEAFTELFGSPPPSGPDTRVVEGEA